MGVGCLVAIGFALGLIVGWLIGAAW